MLNKGSNYFLQPGASPELVSVDEALAQLVREATPVVETETLPLEQALGRVLAAPLSASLPVPAWDSSAMDGYALRYSDLSASGVTRLPIVQRIAAGHPGVSLAPGTAARIFTGAAVPTGADTVVMQEQCVASETEVSISGNIRKGDHVRPAGDDIRAGQTVLAAGQKLRPQHLGLAASIGMAEVPVYRRLKVAIFLTGDELVTPGTPLAPGQIYNSNRYTLIGMLRSLGCEIVDLCGVADNLKATLEALERAAQNADFIISSGGVSVGDEDYIKPAVTQLGHLAMWRIAMKPGKPLAFGWVRNKAFFGLPGNPVSVFVTFCLFVRPFLLKMQGAANVATHTFQVHADFDWPQAGKRREFLRARCLRETNGEVRALIYPNQSSGVLTSLAWADGLVDIPVDTTVRRGELIDFISFSEFFGD